MHLPSVGFADNSMRHNVAEQSVIEGGLVPFADCEVVWRKDHLPGLVNSDSPDSQ